MLLYHWHFMSVDFKAINTFRESCYPTHPVWSVNQNAESRYGIQDPMFLCLFSLNSNSQRMKLWLLLYHRRDSSDYIWNVMALPYILYKYTLWMTIYNIHALHYIHTHLYCEEYECEQPYPKTMLRTVANYTNCSCMRRSPSFQLYYKVYTLYETHVTQT